MLTAGLGGVRRHGCAALTDGGRLLGICQQERVTRVRGAGFNASGLPDEALDLLLQRLGRTRKDVGRYLIAEALEGLAPGRAASGVNYDAVEHHLAHASAAYLTSPFSASAIVVCDHESPRVSVWQGEGATVSRVDWPWEGPGFADAYSRCARAVGFGSAAGDQRLEALARLRPGHRDVRLDGMFAANGESLHVQDGLEGAVAEALGTARPENSTRSAAVAAALQGRIGELFLQFLERIRSRTGAERLCLGGSFFYHSSINTLARQAKLFSDVFVPIDPGNAGLAVGTALMAGRRAASPVSPFMGPAYSGQEIKEILDNCKLQYTWESDDSAIATAVRALQEGTIVGWFDGAMEWGPRALGGRSILASPFAPYVLENLNTFLKHREPWRGYAMSGLDAAVGEHFDGPAGAPYMDGDYRPRDPKRFASVLPSADAAIRVQTVGAQAPARFRRLLEAFGTASGLPFLVNTSFNGFQEPIVCSPRDAVRVFYGSGVDLLVLDGFVLKK